MVCAPVSLASVEVFFKTRIREAVIGETSVSTFERSLERWTKDASVNMLIGWTTLAGAFGLTILGVLISRGRNGASPTEKGRALGFGWAAWMLIGGITHPHFGGGIRSCARFANR
ncbi:MAG: hypothetical protein AAGM38_12460 [Pseudomonadota bacterium]